MRILKIGDDSTNDLSLDNTKQIFSRTLKLFCWCCWAISGLCWLLLLTNSPQTFFFIPCISFYLSTFCSLGTILIRGWGNPGTRWYFVLVYVRVLVSCHPRIWSFQHAGYYPHKSLWGMIAGQGPRLEGHRNAVRIHNKKSGCLAVSSWSEGWWGKKSISLFFVCVI